MSFQVPFQTEMRSNAGIQMRLYDPQGQQLPESLRLCQRAGTTLELTPEEGSCEPAPRLKRYASHMTVTYTGEGAKRISMVLTTVVDPVNGLTNCVNWYAKYEHTHTLEQHLRKVEDGEPIPDTGSEDEYKRDCASYTRKLPRSAYYERRLYDTGHVVERRLTQRVFLEVSSQGQQLVQWQ